MARSTQCDVAIQYQQIIIETRLTRELICWMATHVLHFFALRAQKRRRLAMTVFPYVNTLVYNCRIRKALRNTISTWHRRIHHIHL
jgi:hypothetical protein